MSLSGPSPSGGANNPPAGGARQGFSGEAADLGRLAREGVAALRRGDSAPAALLRALDDLAGGERDACGPEGVPLAELAELGDALADRSDSPGAAWVWLDAIRRPVVLRRIAAEGSVDAWMDRVHRIVAASQFTVACLVDQRVERYGPRTLFRTFVSGRERAHSWLEAGARIEHLGRGLIALADEIGSGPVALLTENRYETALLDLACLCGGFRNVVIPATATDDAVAEILARTEAASLVVSGTGQYRKVAPHRGSLPALRAVYSLDPIPGATGEVRILGDLVRAGRSVAPGRWEAAKAAVRIDDVATVMFTSGTTGRPKGIQFTQRNLVVKRFARALALPDVGDHDVLLCYLPLFHTFGRYLELMGSIFWGAQYAFLEDSSLESLREAMRQVRPTIFISVPKKWMELWEEVARRADPETADESEIRRALRDTVGDRLRWGLSAAGYLDPEIFRFFQRYGVELMSGFGMTEATGGITMTPPGAYRDDTLGVPLPGIEAGLREDGELRIRGPYVMAGYLDDGEGTGLDEAGWFRTGDLMERDESGYFRLVDRIKDLYKNVKGESIAPQRVENLFRDFDAVRRAFLVGDHRPYNTLLIVPNFDYGEMDFRSMTRRELREYFRSVVVSVNRFLAPFERIVDFAVLDRDFDAERGELTPKGTVRRKTVVENFAEIIDPLYRRVRFRAPDLGVEIHVPNWIFQVLGLTSPDVALESGRLAFGPLRTGIVVEKLGDLDGGAELRVGSLRYLVRGGNLDLGVLLGCPALWLGNEELVRFADLPPVTRTRRLRPPREIVLLGRAVAYEPTTGDEDVLRRSAGRSAPALEDVDVAARMLHSFDDDDGFLALGILAEALRGDEGVVRESALLALRMAAQAPSLSIKRRAFQMLFPVEVEAQTEATLQRYLLAEDDMLDENTVARLCEESLSAGKLRTLVLAARGAVDADEAGRRRGVAVLRLLAEYGAAHPARFDLLRAAVARVEASTEDEVLRPAAAAALDRLTEGFRAWLGGVQRIAVDAEEGTEYRWDDVLTFEDGIDPADRARLFRALSNSALLREAIFLFSGEALVRLSDIPIGGVYVSALGERDQRALFRVVTHTRLQGSYDVVICLNRGMTSDEVRGELRWLLATGRDEDRPPLCQRVGGWWESDGLWTEEFLAGESLERTAVRLARRREDVPVDRLPLFWPFFLWSAAWGYLEFWRRTGVRHILGRPSPAHVIVPAHDYQEGTRLLSAAGHESAPDVGEILDRLWTGLIDPLAGTIPEVASWARPELLCSALVEVLGVDEGVARLRGAQVRGGPASRGIPRFLDGIESEGFVPQRLLWAVERFLRWEDLAPDSPPAARAETLLEIEETYRLSALARQFPESRIRFFRGTVLRGVGEDLARGLDGILEAVRRRELDSEGITERLLSLRRHMAAGSAEEYFLARLTYPHLRPQDEADFLSTELGGVRQTDIVVSLEDDLGRPYRVRYPVSAKEVARLHRLFTAARLDVQFRPEHRYLVAVNDRGSLIGGIFYDVDEENRTAHLEKIVVGEPYRKLGVSDGLMNELFNRLRSTGIETVATGFFRPSYFYRFGFSVGKRQAGLVKTL